MESAFGVLQARFAIVRGLTRYFHHEVLKGIMYVYIILHNMSVEDDWEAELDRAIGAGGRT